MTNLPQIAVPVGLFKAGPSGAGGQYEPMTKIRKDIFQLTNMIYGLRMTGAYANLDPKSIIIDIEQDGYVQQDPHSSRPMSFVTDDPKQKDRGIWFGTYKAPNAGPDYSAVRKGHKVKISVAPRQAPITTMHMTIVVPKDGETKIVRTTSTRKVPIYEQKCGQTVVIGYKDEVTTSEMEVPATTEITYTGNSVTQELGPRDFSPEAGGVTKEFEFEIFSSSLPPYDIPTE